MHLNLWTRWHIRKVGRVSFGNVIRTCWWWSLESLASILRGWIFFALDKVVLDWLLSYVFRWSFCCLFCSILCFDQVVCIVCILRQVKLNSLLLPASTPLITIQTPLNLPFLLLPASTCCSSSSLLLPPTALVASQRVIYGWEVAVRRSSDKKEMKVEFTIG